MAINKKPLEEERRLFRECIGLQAKHNEAEIVKYARYMLNSIINGVVTEDGRLRNYDVIDYYSNITLSFEEFFNIIKSHLSLNEIRLFKKFCQYNASKEKVLINQFRNTRRIFYAQFDKYGKLIEGSGREIAEEEKAYIENFIKENELPEYQIVYETCIQRLKDYFGLEADKPKELVK